MKDLRGHEPIEEYLDELLACLRLPPRATRRLLTETEDHLRSAAEHAERAGTSRLAAEREAVSRFGVPAQVAAAASAARRPAAVAVLGVFAWAAVMLSGLGLVAVGVSGALASVFNVIAGRSFVGALPTRYDAAACHHFLALHPAAPTCAVAAVLENSGDAVMLRIAAGVVGLALVTLAWLTRRYLSADPSLRQLLSASIGATATVAFGAATVFLLGQSLDTAIHYGSQGVGWYLSGGIVSAVATVSAGALAWRKARLIRPWRRAYVAA